MNEQIRKRGSDRNRGQSGGGAEKPGLREQSRGELARREAERAQYRELAAALELYRQQRAQHAEKRDDRG